MLATSLLRAILWAQWRSLLNLRSGESRLGRWLGSLVALVWYSLWAAVAVAAAIVLARPSRAELAVILPWGLMSVFFYWQLAPVITASLGAALDLRRLRIYPVPEDHLFLVEILLRLATSFEMPLVLLGALIGLWRNPALSFWWPLIALPLYGCFNLFLAAGLRGLLESWFAHRRVREIAALLLVLAVGAPQLLLWGGITSLGRGLPWRGPSISWPWVSFGRLACGEFGPQDWVLVALWLTVAVLFGRTQFDRSLRADAVETAPVALTASSKKASGVGTLISRLAPDPLAAILEKELRSLARSPRFRLVFLMGFSFGFLIWAPLTRREGSFTEGYPVLVSVYAVLLLSEVLFWNAFGFDRSAAQFWFVAPAPFRYVLVGKNLAGALLATAEVTVVLAVCRLLGAPLSGLKVLEVYGVALTLCLYLLAGGNLSSLRFPRPVNPEQSWGRASTGRFQMLVLFLYPLLGAPVGLAYLVRYLTGSQTAFFAQLSLAALAGAVFYHASLDYALKMADRRKEEFIQTLLEQGGPVLTR
jgi:ABC-2 type transport system permease protein